MPGLLTRARLSHSLLISGLAAGLILLFLPPEQTLGTVIRPVLLHGALVQVGLICFAAAAVMGLVALVRPDPAWLRWCRAVLAVAVIVWLAYALSSMVATYLAWGVAIAWYEPRVQASALTLLTGSVLYLVAVWLDQPRFTALAGLLAGTSAWWLVKGAALLRHPLDPLGSSSSLAFKLSFVGLLAILLFMSVQLTRWLVSRTC